MAVSTTVPQAAAETEEPPLTVDSFTPNDLDSTLELSLPSSEPLKASFYRFQGKRYSKEGSFMEAAKGNFKSSASMHSPDDERLLATARKLFLEFANDSGDGTTKLKKPEMAGLAASVAAEVGVNPRDIGCPNQLFHRYDFTGDEALDEKEGVMMVAAVMRHHQDRMKPDKPGMPKLITLPFRNLEESFELKQMLGKGGQGKVYLAVEKAGSIERVVKFFSKSNSNAPIGDIKDEFRLLRTLDHPRVQRLYDIFEDRRNVYIISEPYKGGDLHSLVPRATAAGVRVTNHWLGRVVLQVVQGVTYLHSNHVMHCDLKEPNAMIVGAAQLDEPSIVVIDFGLANFMTDKRKRISGTPGYMPPEVLQGGLWTPKGDVHALGVMMYQMYAGERCFPVTGGRKRLLQTMLKEKPDMRPLQRYGTLSALIDSMLVKRFQRRPSCAKVLESPFFTCLTETQELDIPQDVVLHLCRAGHKSEVQAAILADIADTQNLSQLQDINQAFIALDTDNSGIIDKDEAWAKLSESLPASKVEGVIDTLLGDDGKIAYTEFMGQMLLMAEADLDRVLWREFSALDKSGNGLLNEAEISAILSRPALASVFAGQALDLMSLMDKDSNGQISFEEFAAAIHGDRDTNANTMAGAHETQEAVAAPVPVKPSTQCTASEPVVKVGWKRKNMTIQSTRRAMQEASFKNVMLTWSLTVCCCWWMPLVFFKAAANVAEDGCQTGLATWLRICAIMLVVVIPVDHCLYYAFSKCSASHFFKGARCVLFIAPLIYIGYSLSGFGVYAAVSEERCLKRGWSGVQPIRLLLAWAILGTVFGCLIMCLGVCIFYVRNLPEDDSQGLGKIAPEP